jgi:hypothetical protein
MPRGCHRAYLGSLVRGGVGRRKVQGRKSHDTAHRKVCAYAVDDERQQYLFAVQRALICSRVVRRSQRKPREARLVVRRVRI